MPGVTKQSAPIPYGHLFLIKKSEWQCRLNATSAQAKTPKSIVRATFQVKTRSYMSTLSDIELPNSWRKEGTS